MCLERPIFFSKHSSLFVTAVGDVEKRFIQSVLGRRRRRSPESGCRSRPELRVVHQPPVPGHSPAPAPDQVRRPRERGVRRLVQD